MDLSLLLAQFTLLAGFASLVAVVINALKKFGVIKDGQAPIVVLLANLVGFIVFVILKLFAPDIDIPATDPILAQVANILVMVLGLVGQLGASKVANLAVRGQPVIGFSYSLEKAKVAGVA